MDQAELRRIRLSQLLDLAQNYKGWTRKELARTLGRDPTKLVPGSGVPKLDLVVDLAGVLDWSIDDVVAYLWGGAPGAADGLAADDNFETLDTAARLAHSEGEYYRLVELAKKAYDVAETPEQRARACNREAGGWDGLGRYTNLMKAVQCGLRLTPVSADFRRMLQANLANAYYSLWSLVEARAISGDLLRWYAAHAPECDRDRKTQAFAHYVAGHTLRRLITAEPDRAREFANLARTELVTARDRFRELADQFGIDSFNGIANTCHGGLVEVEVELEERPAEEALDELADGLVRVDGSAAAAVDGDAGGQVEPPVGDWLESYGWWCIFGCNIALRHLDDERALQHRMAIFTTKADEIADQLDNWSIRERVFTMDHSRWERAVGCTGFEIPRVVDEDDVRVITGTMARFPCFQETGWRILRAANVVRAS